MTTTSDQSAWGFEYNFRCLKWFFRKLLGKLRSAFFLGKIFENKAFGQVNKVPTVIFD